MVESPKSVRSQSPPPQVLRVINPPLRMLISSRLGGVVGSLGVLRFRGRVSGREYEVPVGIHRVDGVPTVFTDAGWRLNFRGGAPVTVVNGGKTQQGTGELLEAPEQVGPALRAALSSVRNPRQLGLYVEKGTQPTDEELAEVRSMIRLKLDDGSPDTGSSSGQAPNPT
jgi:hypothetical protein